MEQRSRHRAADRAGCRAADEGHTAGEDAGGRAQDQAPLCARAARAIANLARLELAFVPGQDADAAQLDVVIGIVPVLELLYGFSGCLLIEEIANNDVLVLVYLLSP